MKHMVSWTGWTTLMTLEMGSYFTGASSDLDTGDITFLMVCDLLSALSYPSMPLTTPMHGNHKTSTSGRFPPLSTSLTPQQFCRNGVTKLSSDVCGRSQRMLIMGVARRVMTMKMKMHQELAQVSRQPTYRSIQESRTPRDERPVRRSGHKAQAAHPTNRRTRDDMLDVVLALWRQSAREAASERRPPGSDAPHVAHSKNKIQT